VIRRTATSVDIVRLRLAAVTAQAKAKQRCRKEHEQEAGQPLGQLRHSSTEPGTEPATELRRNKRLGADQQRDDKHWKPHQTDGQADGQLIDADAQSQGDGTPAASPPHIVDVDVATVAQHHQSNAAEHGDGDVLRSVAHVVLHCGSNDETEQRHGHLERGADQAEAQARPHIETRDTHRCSDGKSVQRERQHQCGDLQRHGSIVSMRPRTGECGQETLQTILVVAFVLLPILLAILSFGSLIHVYIGSQAAAAAGARAAGTGGGFGPDQLQRVDEELRANGIDPATCTVAASAFVVSLDQPISVTVRCPQHIGIPFIFERDFELTSTFVARGEVNR
jgi:hypothetical protein